ncbi:MAG: cysteine desulfurase [Bacteroidota bacterium]|nr:cysteine desulfurase [Bacteroidota bacterium]
MSIDKLTLGSPLGDDLLNPTAFAQLASRIYNEFPGAAEISKNEQDVKHTSDYFRESAFPEPQALPVTPATELGDTLNFDGLTNIGGQAASLPLFAPSQEEIPQLLVISENPFNADLSNCYFLSGNKPATSAPLSSHADYLVSQQTLNGNKDNAPNLHQFVHKVQSVSGGLSESGQPSQLFQLLGSGFPSDQIDLSFLYANVAESAQEVPTEPSTGYYFLREPKLPLYTHNIFDVQAIRNDFPVLHQYVHGKPLVWFDNAATTQKPKSVIDAISKFYYEDNSNIHRGAHTLAVRATDAYEGARKKVRHFVGAASTDEIIFVRGTTEGINLVAQTWGRKFIQPGDEILISLLEHHANIVPWQMLAKEKGAVLKAIPVNENGEIIMEEYTRLLNPRVKLLAVTQASNGLGTILPLKEMIQLARQYDIKVLVDGAQSVAHIPVNVQELDADFFVFSGHKIFAPNGIGAVYGKRALLEVMPPWHGGGNMIKDVRLEETVYNGIPNKFEAGTPNVADAIGLGAALDYVTKIGLENIARYEHLLTDYGTQQLSQVPGLRIIGTARNKVGVLSFVLNDIPIEQVGKYLDERGIAVRAGHHCTQPSLRRFGVEGTVRPSLSLYNTKEEIDRLVDALKNIRHRIF